MEENNKNDNSNELFQKVNDRLLTFAEEKNEEINPKFFDPSKGITNGKIIRDIYSQNHENIQKTISLLLSDSVGKSPDTDSQIIFKSFKTLLKYCVTQRDMLKKEVQEKEDKKTAEYTQKLNDNNKFIQYNDKMIEDLKKKKQELYNLAYPKENQENKKKNKGIKRVYYCDVCHNKKYTKYEDLHRHYVNNHIVKVNEQLYMKTIINNMAFEQQLENFKDDLKKELVFNNSKFDGEIEKLKDDLCNNGIVFKEGMFRNDLNEIKNYLEYINHCKQGLTLEDVENIEIDIKQKVLNIYYRQQELFKQKREAMNAFSQKLFKIIAEIQSKK